MHTKDPNFEARTKRHEFRGELNTTKTKEPNFEARNKGTSFEANKRDRKQKS